MAVTLRAQMQNELVPGLHELFGLKYKSYGEEYKKIYQVQQSERSFEQEQKLSGFGAAPVKQEGMAVAYDQGSQEAWSTVYYHQTIAYAFAVSEEAIEDNLYASVSKRYTDAMARSFAYTKEVKAAAIINNGFTSGINGGDGVTLFNTAHPLVSGGTNSNRPSVHADLNEAAVEAATIQIAKWTDERGLLIKVMPRMLLIPTDLTFVAERICKSVLRTGTADNDISAMVSLKTLPEGYAVNHFITDTASWYIKTDVPDGFKMFERIPFKTSTEGDFETGNFRFKARERYSFGFSDPLGYFGCPGS